MKFLIIGSVAYHNTRLKGMPFKNPNDVDVICDEESFNMFIETNRHVITNRKTLDENKYLVVINDIKYDFEVYTDESSMYKLFNHPSFNDHTTEFVNLIFPINARCASLELQYMFKDSHRFLRNSPHFLKTMNDINMFKYFNILFIKEFDKIFELRKKETYNYSHPNLNTTKTDFFKTNEGVNYKYDHDSIHMSIKILEKPAYSYFLPKGNQVYCNEEMFNKLDDKTKLLAVLEESCVLALERSIIPYGFKNNSDKMFKHSLMKVCTSITSGWFRDFAYNHYNDVVSLHNELEDDWYFTKFITGVVNGTVKPF